MLRGARCRSCPSAGTAPRSSPCAPSRTRLPCKPTRSTSSTRSVSSSRCPPCVWGQALGSPRCPRCPLTLSPRAGPAARLPGGVPGKSPVLVHCARALQVLEKGKEGEDTGSPLSPPALPGCPSPVHWGVHRGLVGTAGVALLPSPARRVQPCSRDSAIPGTLQRGRSHLWGRRHVPGTQSWAETFSLSPISNRRTSPPWRATWQPCASQPSSSKCRSQNTSSSKRAAGRCAC